MKKYIFFPVFGIIALVLFIAAVAVVLLATAFFSTGMLSLGVGALSSISFLQIASDMSPPSLMLCGGFCMLFSVALGCIFLLFGIKSIRLLNKVFLNYMSESYTEFFINTKKIVKFLVIFFALAVIFLAAAIFAQIYSVKNGFKSTVLREEIFLKPTNYISISATNLDITTKYHDGDNIILRYVNDSKITVSEEESSLKITQEDDFTFSLFAREQFSYNLVLLLPKKSYMHIYIHTSSGNVFEKEINTELLEITTKSGNIEADKITGGVKLTTQKGNIFADYKSFKAAGTINNISGYTEVSIPDRSAIELNFFTDKGRIYTEYFEDDYVGRRGDVIKTQGVNPKKLNINTAEGDFWLIKKE